MGKSQGVRAMEADGTGRPGASDKRRTTRRQAA